MAQIVLDRVAWPKVKGNYNQVLVIFLLAPTAVKERVQWPPREMVIQKGGSVAWWCGSDVVR